MIQVAPKATPTPQPSKVQPQKQEETSKDTFFSLIVNKLSEQKPSDTSKPTKAEEETTVTTANTTVMTAVQELIAQLTQDPNALLSQQNGIITEASPILIVPVTTQATQVQSQLMQVTPQQMQAIATKQPNPMMGSTVVQSNTQNPLPQEQIPMQSIVTPTDTQIENTAILQARPMPELQKSNQANESHVAVEPVLTQPIVSAVPTQNSSETSSQLMNAKEETSSFESIEPKKQGESEQNPAAFSMLSKPTTEIQNPMIVKISDEATKLSQTTQTQIADQITMQLSENKSEVTMQLNPEHLGKVSVKLISENGVLTVELHADNPKTQSLLLSSTNEIKALVQGATHNTTQVVASNQSQGMQQNYTQQESKRERQPQEQHNFQQENQSKEDTSMIDFNSIMQELQAKSRYYQRM